jgi:S-formylglutathione hydrolase
MERWEQVEIAGKRADVFEPTSVPRFALLWLHEQPPRFATAVPAGGNSHFTLTQQLEKFRIACVAPHGRDCLWVDRICVDFDPALTGEKHLLERVLPWVEDRFAIPTRSTAMAGIEMGGQGALRFGLKFPKLVRVVAGLNSAIDFHELYGQGSSLDAMYESKERARQDTATLHMHPTDWPPHIWFAADPAEFWHRGNDRLHEKLRAYGVPHSCDLETTGDAYTSRMLPQMLEFLVNSLERESRRLM